MDKPHPFTNSRYFINYSFCLTCDFDIYLVPAQGSIWNLDCLRRYFQFSIRSNLFGKVIWLIHYEKTIKSLDYFSILKYTRRQTIQVYLSRANIFLVKPYVQFK